MSLRLKSLLTGALATGLVIVILMIAARFIISDSFSQLEQQDTEAHVQRALNAIADDLGTVDRTAHDYASWDDSYAFMDSRNPDYIGNNYDDTTFDNTRLSLAMLITPQRQVVFARAYDLKQKQELTVTAALTEQIVGDARLMQSATTLSATTGIMMTPLGPMLLASRPILTGENLGPSRGALIMGRSLDAAEVARLSASTQLDLAVAEPTAWSDPAAQAARAALSDQQPVVVQAVDQDTVGGYAYLNNVDGQPALLLRVLHDRNIYRRGLQTLTYLMFALLATGLVIGVVVLGLQEHTIVLRLSRLDREVRDIGASSDLSQRVSLQGTDEIGRLSTAINNTLASLETAERQLYQREREAITLLDSLPAYAFFKDADGRYVMANQRFCATTNHTHDEIVGKTDYDLYPPERAERYRADDARVMAYGETLDMGEETSGTAPDEIVLDTHKVPVKDEAGKVIGLIGLTFDVTDRKRAAQELAVARDQALEALRFKSQLLAHVSHDLRTPINAVLGYAEMLEAGVYGPLADAQHDPLARIVLSCHQLARLVNDLLSQSRLEAGTLALHNQPFVPAQLIDSIKAVAELAAAAKHLTLVSQVNPDVPDEVCGDYERVHQVVANLVDNAIKFAEQGTIDIRVFRPDADHYAIAVTDSGPGIRIEEQTLVFEAFQQGTAPASGRFKGVGLGLSIVKQFTTLMGGQVSLTSDLGRGTIFTITLPVQAIQEEQA